MIRLRAGNLHGAGSTPARTRTGSGRPTRRSAGQLAMGGWIVAVDSAAEHGHGRAARLERASVRFAVDAAREPADHDRAGSRGLPRERAWHGPPVGGARARADDGEARTVEDRRDLPRPGPRAEAADREIAVSRSRVGRGRPAGHDGRSSNRRPAASGTRAPPRRARGARASEPASAATVRATRATLARPRPESGSRSTARSSSSDAAATRRGCIRGEPRGPLPRPARARPPTPRRAERQAPRPAGAASSTVRSKRSSSARETRSR